MTEEISYPVINNELCKGCMRCIVGCPQNAILLSDDMNDAGYQYALGVFVADGQERDFIELHCPYGYNYESFLLQTVFSCVKRGFAVTDIRFYK